MERVKRDHLRGRESRTNGERCFVFKASKRSLTLQLSCFKGVSSNESVASPVLCYFIFISISVLLLPAKC